MHRSALVAPTAAEPTPLGLSEPGPTAAAGAAVRAPAAAARRAHGLDALRGLFLLSMTFGFTLWEGLFPAWMYHRQEPPPTHELALIAGLTWRDLTYPAFLLSMAAALPIALGRRIERGATGRDVARAALRRGLLLFVFALVVGHSSGYWIGEYTATSEGIGLLGFALMFALFTRRRPDWDPRAFAWVRRLGWAAALAFLALTPLLYGKSFSFTRRDEILAELAFASAAGALVWYATRESPLARLGVLAGVVAASLAAREEGWVQSLWWASPAPWLFEGDLLKLLLVVIPGTLAGDLLWAWMGAPPEQRERPGRSRARLLLFAGVAAAFPPVLVVGLTGRWIAGTTAVAVALVAAGLALVRRPAGASERLLRQLFLWGAFWLLLGLVLEPFEGGIKKVPGTLSYYFAAGGSALMLLVAMVAAVDLLGERRASRVLVEVGQNPMLCYVTYTAFLNPLLDLVAPFEPSSAGAALVRSLLLVAIVAALVRQATRRGVVWRT
jgi:predicted acyltransferase